MSNLHLSARWYPACNSAGVLMDSELKIVWRNPQAIFHVQRWESVEKGPEKSLYIVQEFVSDGGAGYWTTECALQVIRGGRAA